MLPRVTLGTQVTPQPNTIVVPEVKPLLIPQMPGFVHSPLSMAARIGRGEYAAASKGVERVSDPVAIALAKTLAERSPSLCVIGGYTGELDKLRAMVAQARLEGKGIIVYFYFVPWRDAVRGRGASGPTQYMSRLNEVLAIVGDTPCLWQHEPDGHASNLSSTTPSAERPSVSVAQERTDVLRMAAERLMQFGKNIVRVVDISVRGYHGDKPDWTSGKTLAQRLIATGWATVAHAAIAGTANFKRPPELHSWAATVGNHPLMLGVRPLGLPYFMEFYGSEGEPPIPGPSHDVSGISLEQGKTWARSSSPMFVASDVTGYRPLRVQGASSSGAYGWSALIKSIVSPTEVTLNAAAVRTVSGADASVLTDGRYVWCNPVGPVAGPPMIYQPQGGYDNRARCVGGYHATGCVSSNNVYNPRTGTNSAPGPGGAFEPNVLDRLLTSPYFN